MAKKGQNGFVKGDPDAGAPKGNNNYSKRKPWREAIDRAIAQSDGATLRALADRLIQKALEGDVAALKEVGDRLDGRSVQQVEAKVEGHITILREDEAL